MSEFVTESWGYIYRGDGSFIPNPWYVLIQVCRKTPDKNDVPKSSEITYLACLKGPIKRENNSDFQEPPRKGYQPSRHYDPSEKFYWVLFE